MKVIQVYLPTYVTNTVLYAGISQPLLRYYEKLVAVHIAPVLYKDLARTPWEKIVNRVKTSLGKTLEEVGYHRVYGAAFLLALTGVMTLLSRKGKPIPNWMQKLADELNRFIAKKVKRESEEIQLMEYDNKKEDRLFTEIKLGKNYLIQFISVPLTLEDLTQLFKVDKKKELESFKKKAFASLASLELSSQVDVKAMVLTVPAIICSIEELEDIQNMVGNQNASLIVVDTVNEVVLTKLVLYNKVFKYSAPLKQIVKTADETKVSLERLASMLRGIKIGATL